jgi:hypothetical protein
MQICSVLFPHSQFEVLGAIESLFLSSAVFYWEGGVVPVN